MKNDLNQSIEWIDVTLFLMIGNAEITDYKLSDAELKVIMEKADTLLSFSVGEGGMYTSEDVQRKVQNAYSWYMRIQENVPEEELDQTIMNQIQRAAKMLKDEEWFNTTFAENVINDMVDIAKADGEIIPNEKGSLNALADFWGVEKPF